MTRFAVQPALRRAALFLAATALSVPGAGAAAAAQPAPATAAADVISFVLTPRVTNNALQFLEVEARLTGDADGETKLYLPVNNPDDPQWKGWLDMKADNGVLAGDGPERLLRHAPSAPLILRYKITQTSPDIFNNIVQPTYFSVLGAGVFFQLDDKRDPEYRFRWGQLPGGWTAVSDLDHKIGDPSTPYPISTLYGGSDIVVKEHQVGAGRLRLAMRNDSSLKPEYLGDLLGKIGKVSNDLWQDSGTDYLVTLTTLPDFRGQAGTGLGDAFALYLPADSELLELRNTLAHEYLHTWIGRRFGGGPRWFSEGFTQYYSPLVNLRTGGYSLADFATQWNAMLRTYAVSPLRLAPASEAEEKWGSNRDAEQLAENRGGMVAALLDRELHQRSKGKLRLSDVMVEVKKDRDSKRGSGTGPERIVAKAREMAGIDLQPLIDKHLVRGESVTLPADAFGKCLNVTTSSVPAYDRGFDVEGLGKPVTKVDPDSRAYAAGIREGMIVVAREGGKAGDSSIENAYRIRDAAGERVIRYLPVGREVIQLQQVRVVPGIEGAVADRCAH